MATRRFQKSRSSSAISRRKLPTVGYLGGATGGSKYHQHVGRSYVNHKKYQKSRFVRHYHSHLSKKKHRPKGKHMNCKPKYKDGKRKTCYTPDLLRYIRDEYNKSHTAEEKIDSEDPVQIWHELSKRLVNCSKEDCWLQEIKNFAEKERLTNAIFAPKIERIWENSLMTTMTIKSVMKPYECDKYPDFVFIGPTPIDYDSKPRDALHEMCVTEELCNFDLKKYLAKGKTKFGIVLNLDEHYKGGSHWTAMYVDAGGERPIVFYFDSQGLTYLKVDGFKHKKKNIDRLIDMFVDQGKEAGIEFEVLQNKLVHQVKDTECGIYAMFFLITMLTGETEFDKNMTLDRKIELFTKHHIPDEYMTEYRYVYFNEK
jgi:hypothetical protein